MAARRRAGAGSQQRAGSGTCLLGARVCSLTGLLCKAPHAGVRCPPSRQPQERAVAREPPSCPRSGCLRGRKGTGGRWQGQATAPTAQGLPSGAEGRGVTGRYRSTSAGAVGTISCLHGAGGKPAVAVGLPGHAETPAPSATRGHTQRPISASNWSSPEVNYKDLRQLQQLGRGLPSHEQPGATTQGCSAFFFQCEHQGHPTQGVPSKGRAEGGVASFGAWVILGTPRHRVWMLKSYQSSEKFAD